MMFSRQLTINTGTARFEALASIVYTQTMAVLHRQRGIDPREVIDLMLEHAVIISTLGQFPELIARA
jgi:hypothetical protein